MPGERLLLVDDEDNLRSMLEAALRHLGFEVHPVANGRDALAAAATVQPDLIVLDVMLPDLDGFEVCRRLRTEGRKVPVLFLTAKDATDDKVRGLTLGGDDYLVKPFSLEELVARVNAVLRRSGLAQAGNVLRCGDLVMDDEAHRVERGGKDISLSPTEYNLLHYLLVNQGKVVSKAQILDHVWQYDFGGDGGAEMTTVGDVMSRDLLTIEPETTLVEAAAAMTARRVGAVLVVSGDGLTGILTERDVMRAVASGDVAGHVADWMTRGPETVDADESTQQAGVVMIHGGFRHLPVLDGGTPCGIVSIRDLMRVVLDDVSPRGV